MSNLLSLANIYNQKPIRQAVEFNLTDKLLLYGKTGYIHIYISIKRYLLKILQQLVPDSVARLIISYVSIEKSAYLPTRISKSDLGASYSGSYKMSMYSNGISIILNILPSDKNNHVTSELNLLGRCSHQLMVLIKILVKFYEKNYDDRIVITDVKSINIGSLVYQSDIYRKKAYQLPNNCDCRLDNKKCFETCLPWIQYHNIKDKFIEKKTFNQIYYDMIKLYLYLNNGLKY